MTEYSLKPEECNNHGTAMTIRRTAHGRVCDYCGKCLEDNCGVHDD
jgi:hypothetical protein